LNKNRQHAINRLWEQLAMVAVEDGARSAAKRQRVNSEIVEDAFAVTFATEDWPVAKRDTACAGVNLTRVPISRSTTFPLLKALGVASLGAGKRI
jgi:hypothetical protein